MSKLKKNMCKIAKDGLKSNEEAIMREAAGAKFICKSCLRTASEKDLLCSPKKLKVTD